MNGVNIDNLSEFYKALNSTEVLRAQSMIQSAPQAIEDKLSYDMSAESIKAANDAIKHIETNRKLVTLPLDTYKKSIMEVERDATAPLKEYIEQRKALMIDYSNELERIADMAKGISKRVIRLVDSGNYRYPSSLVQILNDQTNKSGN